MESAAEDQSDVTSDSASDEDEDAVDAGRRKEGRMQLDKDERPGKGGKDHDSDLWFARVEYFWRERDGDELQVHLRWCVFSPSVSRRAWTDTLTESHLTPAGSPCRATSPRSAPTATLANSSRLIAATRRKRSRSRVASSSLATSAGSSPARQTRERASTAGASAVIVKPHRLLGLGADWGPRAAASPITSTTARSRTS